jgi:1-deoxy-D-xylulose-5-phosphate synthase
MEEFTGRFLKNINKPSDLRNLSVKELPEVCKELRNYIIDVVSTNPGHFGASLGVVELTVALHYVYNTPFDQLVWDVGHQAYGHKILTGRRDIFTTNRKYKGLSGFPRREESEFDTFGVGHSSTSISASLGMAVAASLDGSGRKVVAVIGDGALTAGMAFEGLNNAGAQKSDLLVILNDNNMAIDPNVGVLNQYLLKISKSHAYNRVKTDVWEGLGKLHGFGARIRRIIQKNQHAVKNLLLKENNLFESLNFRYFGPVDGHDVVYLTEVLSDLKEIPGPKLLHVITQKGKGYKFAELNQTQFHAPGKFNKSTGEIYTGSSSRGKVFRFQHVFGKTMVELAERNEKIVAITPAMSTGCSLDLMMKKMPTRTFDVGIAEQHAVTFSAGLATQGYIPFCNIYSTFMQRAYDQVIHDVALQNLPVVFCLDRAGLVGEDGATHHGVFDMAFMRHIPNMILSAPMDEEELRNLMYTAQLENAGPFSIRYPRGYGMGIPWDKPFRRIEIGKGRVLSEGNQLVILTIGKPGIFAQQAVEKLARENIQIAHYDMRFIKPLDTALLHTVFKRFNTVMTIEDGVIKGGFGSAVAEFMAENGYSANIAMLGVPDSFIDQGTQEELYKECGFDVEGICQSIRALIPAVRKKRNHLILTK